MFFRNYYRCVSCEHEWTDVWSAQCDDDCPNCGARHMSPYRSDDAEELSQSQKIALLNDAFRKTLSGGRAMMTAGVNELPNMVKAEVLCRVAAFNDFSADNDPHGEHDFGSLDVCGRKFFWKIDLYEEPDVKDKNGESVVTRVLTIMRADEY